MAANDGNDKGGTGFAAADGRRTAGPQAIARVVDRIVARSGGRRGFAEAGLLADWAAIVGPELARQTAPERLVRRGGEGGVLHLRVAPGFAVEVQHLAPLIVERINAACGRRAVDRLALKQGVVGSPAARRRPRLRPLDAAELGRLEAQLAGVDEPELAAALRGLGEAVLGSPPR